MKGVWYQTLWNMAEHYREQPAFLFYKEKTEQQIYGQEFMRDLERKRQWYGTVAQKRIGLWAENSYDWILCAAAGLLAGKDVIFLDAGLSDEDLLGLASYTDAELLLTDRDIYDSAEVIRKQYPMRLVEETVTEEIRSNDSEEGTFLCFTSGTSKSAKGVVITAEILAGCVDAGVLEFPGEQGEKIYLPLPYHHIYGFTQIFHILKRGGTVCIGKNRYMTRELKTYQPQTALLVPSMLRHILEKDQFPASLYAVATGGSMFQMELAEAAKRKGILLYNLYGLSETLGGICTSTEADGYVWMRPEEGVRFTLSREGELGIYLPFHMAAYYKKKEATQAVLENERDLFWTGDAAELNEKGYARIRGRLRDTIVLENGEKIHAEDTDAELRRLDGVQEAAVIGVDGELVAVFVLEKEGSADAVMCGMKKLNRKKTPYTRMKKVWFRETPFPRTATGKLKRYQLENEYKAYKGTGV